MRHTKVAALAFLAALSTTGCVGVSDAYYREPVVVRRYYAPPPVYYGPPQVVYVQPYYPRHRHGRWHDD